MLAFGTSGTLLLFLAIAVLLLAYERWRIRGMGTSMVLQVFQIDQNPSAEQIIMVRGRPAGILGWLLNLFHLEYDETLRAGQYDLTVERSSLNGFSSQYLPLRDIGFVLCQYYRAFSFLIFSLILLLLGILTFLWLVFDGPDSPYARQKAFSEAYLSLLGFVVLATVFYLIYMLSKRIIVSVETSGGSPCGISFRRSIIGNQTVEFAQGLDLAEVLNNKILAQNSGFHTKGGDDGKGI